MFAVLVETVRAAAFKNATGIDLGELVLIDAQDLGIAVLGRAGGQAQIALEVEGPAGNALSILAQQSLLAGGEFQFVEIVPRLVAVIESNVDGVRIALGDLKDLHPRALHARHVARRRCIGAGFRLGCRVDSIDVVVLVAVLVLYVKNVFAVPRPEITSNWPLGFGGQQARGAEGLIYAFHVDVARVFPRLQAGDVLSVRRDFRGGDLWITEDQLAIDERRQPAPCGRRRRGRAGHFPRAFFALVLRAEDRNTQHQAKNWLEKLFHD